MRSFARPIADFAVIGAGGHARVVCRAAALAGWRLRAVFDDDASRRGTNWCGAEVMGGTQLAADQPWPIVIAIGDNRSRERIAGAVRARWSTVLDPRAILDADAAIGDGACVLAGAVVQVGASLGVHSIVNSNATVEHDCRVGDFAHVASGATLAGGVVVGHGAFIGANATVLPGVRIGDRAVLGAGSVATRDLPDGVTAVGAPARRLHRRVESAVA